MKLLIFDDEVNITKASKRLLAPHFEKVMTANNIEDALMLLNEADIVITDYQAPTPYDGEEMINNCRRRGIPVILCSATPPEHLKIEIVEKPFSLDLILRAVRATLK